MKKVKYIALALVLCLGLIGGAYALWEQTAVIDGTVSSADFDIEWVVFQIRDTGGQWTDPNTGDARDVPAYVDADAGIDADDTKKAWITISNLYPQGDLKEEVAIEGHMANNSSIPVKFNGAEVAITNNVNGLAEELHVIVTLGKLPGGSQPWEPIYYDLPAGGMPLTELEDFLNNWLDGVELDPGDHLTFGENTLYFYLPGDAPLSCSSGLVEFSVELDFIQFNAP